MSSESFSAFPVPPASDLTSPPTSQWPPLHDSPALAVSNASTLPGVVQDHSFRPNLPHHALQPPQPHYTSAVPSTRPPPAFYTSCFRLMPSHSAQQPPPPIWSWVSHTQPSHIHRSVSPLYQQTRPMRPYLAGHYQHHQSVVPGAGPSYPYFHRGVYPVGGRRGGSSVGLYGDPHGNWLGAASIQHPPMIQQQLQQQQQQRVAAMTHQYPSDPSHGTMMFPMRYPLPQQQQQQQHHQQQAGSCNFNQSRPQLHNLCPSDSTTIFPQFHHPPSYPHPSALPPHPVPGPSSRHHQQQIDLIPDLSKPEPFRVEVKGECSYHPSPTSSSSSPSISATLQGPTQMVECESSDGGNNQGPGTAGSSILPSQSPHLNSSTSSSPVTSIPTTTTTTQCFSIVRPKPVYAKPPFLTAPSQVTVVRASLPAAGSVGARDWVMSSALPSSFLSTTDTTSSTSSSHPPASATTQSPKQLPPTVTPSSASPPVSKGKTPVSKQRKPRRSQSSSSSRKPRRKPTGTHSTQPSLPTATDEPAAAASTTAEAQLVPVHPEVALVEGDVEISEQVVEVGTVEPNIPAPTSFYCERRHGGPFYKDFASLFKTHRLKLGYTFEAVAQQVAIRYGLKLLTTNIQKFEELRLNSKMAGPMVDILDRWMKHCATAAGTSEDDLIHFSTTTTSIYPQRVRKHLEMVFSRKKTPTMVEMQRLAQLLGVERDYVRTWFTNRRKVEKCLGKRPMEKRGRIVSIKRLAVTPNAVAQKGQPIPSPLYDITVEVPSIHPRDTGSSFPTNYTIEH